ncbi:hypothetical protein GCM10022247_64750 [Allokutzneria multivorans]|uniref:N-acetyltransferase domain-containing protein n=1 Tax=Allokutzneria multivorans TaxID=1142134 RepID=A0ABP7TT95_9PSEU
MSTRPTLVGEHITLRPLAERDRDVFVRIYTSAALTRYLGVDRMTREDAAALFHKHIPRPGEDNPRHTFALTLNDDDSMHGMIGLLVEGYGSNAMITGLVVIPSSPLRGHAIEAGRLVLVYAFGHLGLHRVWAGHRSDHVHMRRVMDGADLLPEATLHELFQTQGRWHDVTTYAALSAKWRESASPREVAMLDGFVAV